MTNESIHVLLVEDNPGDADLVRERLAEAPFPRFLLKHVEDLAAAVQLAGREDFDALLLDLSLPDAHGLEVVRRLRARVRSQVPLVVLTGCKDQALALEALREGAQDYLFKGQLDGPLLVRTLRYAIERQRTQEALRKAEEQCRQGQRMEAVGRLAGGVAHDINNMMTVVTGLCELLLYTPAGDERPPREVVEQIKLAGERAATLTRQLLAFSRRQMLRPVVLDLNAVVGGMERMLRSLIREDVEMSFTLDPALRPVKADPAQIEQVLLNLAINARDAMPCRGKLRVETANVQLDADNWPTDLEARPGPYAVLTVRDTGCGMDPDTKSRIFEPFFTTKEQGKGTGMGLAVVYGIVMQSGGQISVTSEPGEGTTFTIYLPQVAEPVATPVAGPHRPLTARGTETVLLAEDEPSVRHLTRRVLERFGYKVLEARTGAEALRISEGYAGPIHLLVTDTIMPGMSGRELCECLHGSRPEVKVLFVSGYTENVIVQHGVLDPDVAFLQKPFTPEALGRKVREILDHSLSTAGT